MFQFRRWKQIDLLLSCWCHLALEKNPGSKENQDNFWWAFISLIGPLMISDTCLPKLKLTKVLNLKKKSLKKCLYDCFVPKLIIQSIQPIEVCFFIKPIEIVDGVFARNRCHEDRFQLKTFVNLFLFEYKSGLARPLKQLFAIRSTFSSCGSHNALFHPSGMI